MDWPPPTSSRGSTLAGFLERRGSRSGSGADPSQWDPSGPGAPGPALLMLIESNQAASASSS